MILCPTCGHDLPLERGPLSVRNAPAAVHWKGIRRVGLTPQQHAFLSELVRRPFVSYFALELLVGEGQPGKTVKVVICNLRKWLREQGLPVVIENDRGRGYVLRID